MDLGLKGKKTLVTGSTTGIGLAAAKAFAAEGAIVYINGRSKDRVDQAISSITKDGLSVLPAVFDLSTKEGADAIIQAIPSIDILVNNLGIYELKPFESITDEEWLRFFNVNVLSGIRLCRHYFPQMKTKNWGRIVFISSESGVSTPADMIHYGMTKTAQLAVARGLAELTVSSNVTVNSVLPGPTRTEGVEQMIKKDADRKKTSTEEIEREFFKSFRPTSLIHRFATPEEVANLIVFVCSERAAAINGAALRVEGGVVRSIL